MATYFRGSKDYVGQNLNEKWSDLTKNQNFVETVSSLAGGGGGAIPIETVYPTTDATKVGQQFIYKGEIWRYAGQEFTNLPIGTPIPLKGFYILEFNVEKGGSGVLSVSIKKDDLNIAQFLNYEETTNTNTELSLGLVGNLIDVGADIANFFKFPNEQFNTIAGSRGITPLVGSYVSGNTTIAFSNNLTSTFSIKTNDISGDANPNNYRFSYSLKIYPK